jgi:hypothetical protein
LGYKKGKGAFITEDENGCTLIYCEEVKVFSLKRATELE